MSKPFKVCNLFDDGKFVEVEGPNGLRMDVDTDDVDLYETAKGLKKMLAILNEHWNDPKYKDLNPEPWQSRGTDEENQEVADRRYDEAKAIFKELRG